MATTGTSQLAGRMGSLLAFVGVLVFFAGLFFLPKAVMLVGVGLIIAALAAYFVEEMGQRRARA